MEPDRVKQALQHVPCGVLIVTTLDQEQRPVGFTASSFVAVSLSPATVLVCLSHEAACHGAFQQAQRIVLNILQGHHEPLARKFATRSVNKFLDAGFVHGPHGIPVLPDALIRLSCRVIGRHPYSDHTIMIAQVEQLSQASAGDALVSYRRRLLPMVLADAAP
ncbi:Flavin reductase like domain [Xanthomonas bromi]|uniref:Flavin reductase n=1 Tax=Xanthomonas bromi TaxID=56449 RepID=A0A1C3NR37_9XANT|nr:flavin reductase family protein [Xanthomonas bromi]PPV05197.1 flavin reductase [Xanthomonas bromi]SBV52877.1 Flavin reductase like domain [Xanthomonas bromi]